MNTVKLELVTVSIYSTDMGELLFRLLRRWSEFYNKAPVSNVEFYLPSPNIYSGLSLGYFETDIAESLLSKEAGIHIINRKEKNFIHTTLALVTINGHCPEKIARTYNLDPYKQIDYGSVFDGNLGIFYRSDNNLSQASFDTNR